MILVGINKKTNKVEELCQFNKLEEIHNLEHDYRATHYGFRAINED